MQEKYRQRCFILLFIGTTLITLHLNLTQQFSRADYLTQSLLFWSATVYLLWQKKGELHLKTDTFSILFACVLLALLLYKSLHLFSEDYFLQMSPILSFLVWGLLASGIKGLKQYLAEFFLLGFLAIPWSVIYIFDISLVTAKFSAFILSILGFEVTRQGVWIILPTGSVEVYNGCSGVQMSLQILGLSWIILAIASTNLQQKIWLPILAIAIGFFVNGVRVALMAILVALSDAEGFEYWHVGTGSLIFSAIAVVTFLTIWTKTISLE